MPRVVVLAVGYDPVLLKTRGQVLQSEGYTVVSVRSLKRAITQFAEGDFDLVVLCHSIPQEDRQRLAYLIRGHSSRTPIVFVSSGLCQYEPSADLTTENNPDDLLSDLREVLRKNREMDDREATSTPKQL